jgi:UDP-glucose 4-epimerase
MEIQSTINVLSACSGLEVRKVVLMSSTMCYGALADNSPWLGEDDELRADRWVQFFGDKIEAEGLLGEFSERNPERIVSVLRVGPMLGPNTSNVLTSYVGNRIVPMLAGFDPPVQIVHEVDVVRAFMMVIAEDHPGTFNIVGEAVVPLATAVRILGHAPVPVVEPVAGPVLSALWGFRLGGLHPAFIPYLKYPFLASGERAAEAFGFTASFPPVEVLGDYGRALTRRRLEGRSSEG